MKIYITGLPSGYEVEHLVRLFYPMAPLTLTPPEAGEDCVWAEKKPDGLWAMVRQGGKCAERTAPLPVTVDRIIDEVARTYGVTAEDIRGQRRSNQISTARQVAMYVVREITGMTQLEIGQEFGGRDHSTVVYALQQVTKAIQTDPRKKEVIEDIIKNIRNLNG